MSGRSRDSFRENGRGSSEPRSSYRMTQRVASALLVGVVLSGCQSVESNSPAPTSTIAPSKLREAVPPTLAPALPNSVDLIQQLPNEVPFPEKNPSVARHPEPVHTDGVFQYVGGSQYAAARGATVELDQAYPYVDQAGHSLMELAIESSDGKQIVEVGWTVATDMDNKPDLFTFHWVDGQGTCYNSCGFVSTVDNIRPGDTVVPGTTGRYGIVHSDSNHEWDIIYDNETIGYYPDSLWGGRFTQTGLVQAFGEVASPDAHSCTDMGDGTDGGAPGATKIGDFSLIGTDQPANLQAYESSSEHYVYGQSTPTGMSIGGAGAC